MLIFIISEVLSVSAMTMKIPSSVFGNIYADSNFQVNMMSYVFAGLVRLKMPGDIYLFKVTSLINLSYRDCRQWRNIYSNVLRPGDFETGGVH